MLPEWEIWLDIHLSPIIAKWMAEHTGLIVKSAYALNHHTLSDIEIYNKAKEYGNIIFISKDTDFPELISRLGAPPKLISLKIGNCDNRALWNILKPRIQEMITYLLTADVDIIELDQ